MGKWESNTIKVVLLFAVFSLMIPAASIPSTFATTITNEDVKLTASDAGAGDFFGNSVSISGDTAIIGAELDKDAGFFSGSAYVFDRNQGGADNWGEVIKLSASDAGAFNEFGFSVSISGDAAVVGAFGSDGSNTGSVYVFDRNQGGADNWGEVTKLTASDADALDQFGGSVSISGDILVVGAAGNSDAGSLSGSAYVFDRNQGGADNWGEVTKLTASDAAVGYEFGSSVSISEDTVVIGAVGGANAGSNTGTAYVFVRNQGGADNWGEVTKLTASDAATADNFGSSVSISDDTVIVGAKQHSDAGSESGSAYVFDRNQGGADNWGEVTKLTASDAAANDLFGRSVSISGDAIVVGAEGNSDAGSESGSAYLFDRNQGGADNWGEVTKLTASDAAAGDKFGFSISLFSNTAVVGAAGSDGSSFSGSAYIFELIPPNSPPDCSTTNPSQESLWPPNHKFVDITVNGVTDPDGNTITITIIGITQDEAVDAKGSGNTAPDGEIDGDTAKIRAERSGNGDGRVYEITFDASDGNGGMCSGSVSVGVPHDKKGTAVDSGQDFDSTTS